LTDRKHELRRLLSKIPESRMRYVEHIEQHGTALFERLCRMDLEGIVAKHSFGNYVTDRERNDMVQRLRTEITRRWQDGRSCSNVNVTGSLFRAGIHAN
jgi:ATP-dependent DNA ligase